MKKKRLITFACFLFFSVLFSGCAPSQFLGPTLTPTPTITNTPSSTPTSPPTITPSSTRTLTPTITPTPTPATISFDLEGGGTYQMLRFETAQTALTYIAQHAVWYQEDSDSARLSAMMSWNVTVDKATPEEIAAYRLLGKIPGLVSLMGLTYPQHVDQFFNLFISKLADGTMLTFETKEVRDVFIYVDEDSVFVQKAMGVLSPKDFQKCITEGGTRESCEKPSLEISTPTLRP